MWDVIICPCSWYLFLAPTSAFRPSQSDIDKSMWLASVICWLRCVRQAQITWLTGTGMDRGTRTTGIFFPFQHKNQDHCNRNALILMKFPSLPTLGVVIFTTFKMPDFSASMSDWETETWIDIETHELSSINTFRPRAPFTNMNQL